jgi:hypothetical protein
MPPAPQKPCITAEDARLVAEDARLMVEEARLAVEVVRLEVEEAQLEVEEARLVAEAARMARVLGVTGALLHSESVEPWKVPCRGPGCSARLVVVGAKCPRCLGYAFPP